MNKLPSKTNFVSNTLYPETSTRLFPGVDRYANV